MEQPLSQVRTLVRQLLNDEMVPGQETDFADDEIDVHIWQVIQEISMVRPRIVWETKQTTAASREIDISSITDLLLVNKAEWRVGTTPPDYRNVIVKDSSTIILDILTVPSAAETVSLECHKLHSLTEEDSTLDAQAEHCLLLGASAKVGLAWINTVRGNVKSALALLTDVNGAIENMTARITKAVTDLTTGRGYINKVNYGGNPENDYATYASRELANASTYLAQSQGYVREMTARLNSAGVINSYQAWANMRLMEYRQALRRIAVPQVSQIYPKS